MSNHQWCRDTARDEAIRAAEDAAAVPAIQHRDLPEVVAALTERVARLEAAQATIGTGDVFRDVGCGSTADEIARLTAERDAALRERDAAKEECERLSEWVPLRASMEVARLKARVAELEAAPPPRGWLTAEEREAVEMFIRMGEEHDDVDAECRAAMKLRALLARETPPRVKVPHLDDLEADERPVWESACHEWIAAIRAAGGEVE